MPGGRRDNKLLSEDYARFESGKVIVMQHRIIFVGEVSPRAGDWYFDGPVYAARDDERIQMILQNSVFQVRVDTDGPEELDDDWFDRVWLRCLAPVRASLDIMGFHIGATLQVERLTALVNDGVALFPAHTQPRFRLNDNLRVDGDVMNAYFYAAMTNPPFRHALADVRQAQRLDDDAAFYSYRAIEGLRQLFVHEDESDKKDKAKSWERLRSALNVTEAEIGAVADAAKARRHGGDDETAFAERVKHVHLARNLIVRYAEQMPKVPANAVPDVESGGSQLEEDPELGST